MKTLQKFGGFAALYLAAAYLIGMVLFIVVLDYPSITNPAQKVALNVDKQMVSFLQAKDNILQAVTGQDPYTMGYSSIEAAVKVLGGESVEKMTIVPGQTLSRTDPKNIEAVAKTLK